MKIALIGHYPPPGGGVNIHIQRLFEALSSEDETWVLDPYTGTKQVDDPATIIRCGDRKLSVAKKLARSLGKIRPQIAHFHLAAMNNFLPAGLVFLALARGLGAACIITIHSGSFSTKRVAAFSPTRKLALRALVALSNKIITVNEEQKTILLDYGLKAENCTVLPAFLPPKMRQTKPLSHLVQDIKKDQRQLYLSSGNGVPLYGFHLIIEALGKLPGKTATSLVLCLYEEQNADYIARLEAQAKAAGVDLRLTRDLDAEEFSWLLSKSLIYIRATDRDGDAVAIREALHYGISVIASDVVPRPPACELFENENASSLQSSLERFAASHEGTSQSPDAPQADNDPVKDIRNVYALAISPQTNTAKISQRRTSNHKT